MKKIISTLLMAFMLMMAMPCVAQSARCGNQRDSYYNNGCHHRHHYHPRYIVTENSVYFGNMKVQGASASSFTILQDGYAKDTWNVYFEGKKINGASTDSFKVLDEGYARDTWSLYLYGSKLSGVDVDSFTLLADYYSKDTWNVYFDGKK